MKTLKTLTLAALAALSIGAGGAMAQEADYQNLGSGGRAPTAPQLDNASVPSTNGRDSLVTMFGAAQRTNLNAQPVFDGSDGGGH